MGLALINEERRPREPTPQDWNRWMTAVQSLLIAREQAAAASRRVEQAQSALYEASYPAIDPEHRSVVDYDDEIYTIRVISGRTEYVATVNLDQKSADARVGQAFMFDTEGV